MGDESGEIEDGNGVKKWERGAAHGKHAIKRDGVSASRGAIYASAGVPGGARLLMDVSVGVCSVAQVDRFREWNGKKGSRSIARLSCSAACRCSENRPNERYARNIVIHAQKSSTALRVRVLPSSSEFSLLDPPECRHQMTPLALKDKFKVVEDYKVLVPKCIDLQLNE